MVTLEEARDYWSVVMQRMDAYLAKAVSLERVPQQELSELHRMAAEWRDRLCDQPDPYVEFRESQALLLRKALEQHGSPAGLEAMAEYRRNEALLGRRA